MGHGCVVFQIFSLIFVNICILLVFDLHTSTNANCQCEYEFDRLKDVKYPSWKHIPTNAHTYTCMYEEPLPPNHYYQLHRLLLKYEWSATQRFSTNWTEWRTSEGSYNEGFWCNWRCKYVRHKSYWEANKLNCKHNLKKHLDEYFQTSHIISAIWLV